MRGSESDADPRATRASLLVRIRNSQDHEAWEQFVDLYEPLIQAFARKRGVQDADVADLTQMVLQAVAGGAARFIYDPECGSFRAWLFQVIRFQLHNLRARAERFPKDGDTAIREFLQQYPAPEEESAYWDREYEQRLFACAAERVRQTCSEMVWQAFWQTAVEDRSAKHVGAALGMTVGAIYTAKSRVMSRIKQEIDTLRDHEPSLPEKPP